MTYHFKEILFNEDGELGYMTIHPGPANEKNVLVAYLNSNDPTGKDSISVFEAIPVGISQNIIGIDEFAYDGINGPEIKLIFKYTNPNQNTTIDTQNKTAEQIWNELKAYHENPDDSQWKPIEIIKRNT